MTKTSFSEKRAGCGERRKSLFRFTGSGHLEYRRDGFGESLERTENRDINSSQLVSVHWLEVNELRVLINESALDEPTSLAD